MLHRRHQEAEMLADVDTSGSPTLLVGTIIGVAGIVVGFFALLRVGLITGGGAPTRTARNTRTNRASPATVPNDVNGVAHQSSLVHYISPFGASAWLPDWQADAFLEQDDKRWLRLEELEMVTAAQRAVGPPHIEQATDN